jgi:glucosyl-dolichyl phosphate glucuronosyltransferase
MPDAPTFSIVLCTRNRAQLLEEALESLLLLDYPADEVELLLVDNASNDDTPLVAERFRKRAPFFVRVIREAETGLSAARNRGIREARGHYLFFTDDDQAVDPAVLREHARVAETFGARAIQGGIALRFRRTRPEWLRGSLASLLGETPDRAEGDTSVPLFGGNMVIRKEVFERHGGFRVDLGKGRAGYSEDSELSARLHASGELVVFAPSARVYHLISGDRMTPGFFRRVGFDKGRSHGRLDLDGTAPRTREMARDTRLAGKDALRSMLRGDRHGSIEAQARMLFSLGRLLTRAASALGRAGKRSERK